MKHIKCLPYLFLLLISISLSAQVTSDTSHKYQMISAINSGDFEKAAEELMFVREWNVDLQAVGVAMDITEGINFLQYADSIHIQTPIMDSLVMLTVRTSDLFGGYSYEIKKNHIDALYYRTLSVILCYEYWGADHLNYANSLHNLAKLYQDIGDYVQAEQLYLDVLNIRKSALGENHPDCAASSNYLGMLYYQMGECVQAEKHYLDALRISKAVFGENHPEYAIVLNNLGLLYNDMGEYTYAETYYLDALNIYKAVFGENHPEYATTLNNLALLYKENGNYVKAEKHYLDALRIRKAVFGENHPEYATLLNNIGLLYNKMGNYVKAEKYYLEALNIYKAIIGENSPNYAKSLNNIGVLYNDIGNYVKAEKHLLDALNIYKAVFGENHPEYATTLNNLGLLYQNIGDYVLAEKYYLEALNIYKAVFGENHPAYATSLNNLGVLYKNTEDYAQAEKHYLDAVNIYKAVFGEKSPNYTIILYNLGLYYLDLGKYINAEPYLMHAQQKQKYLVLQSINYMSEQQREAFWESSSEYFTATYTHLYYKQHTQQPSISTSAYNNELFVKGLLLNSSESVKRSILESNDTTLINQWNELTTKKQQILVLQEKDPQSDYLKQILEEAEQLEKQITIASADFRENQAMWQITWDSVRNHLSPNEVAIEYFSARVSKDSTMYCALFLRQDSEYPEMIPLFEKKEVSSYLSSDNINSTNNSYDFSVNGDTITQLVWSKILPQVKEGETIYFAPSGLLHQLAIEYLPYDETRTMSDIYNMVRISSTREIVMNKTISGYTKAAVYGGIKYDTDIENMTVESYAYDRGSYDINRGSMLDTTNRGNAIYLPGTKKEAEHINSLLIDNNISALLYTSSQANEESFKALSGQHNNILHIGTHGFTWTDSVAKQQDYFADRMLLIDQKQHYDASIDPLNRCGLLFAGANIALQGHSHDLPEGVQDGILTAKEISLMDLRDANLVVLSACETAKGDITSEGVFGLQRAFKMAGVQTIIMSLWKVNDQATQLLMTEFYNNWIGKKQAKREAFRNAQNTVRSQYEEPEYWAGFVMLD